MIDEGDRLAIDLAAAEAFELLLEGESGRLAEMLPSLLVDRVELSALLRRDVGALAQGPAL
jgi:hypothetical protein